MGLRSATYGPREFSDLVSELDVLQIVDGSWPNCTASRCSAGRSDSAIYPRRGFGHGGILTS
jgi:hypothetical protein